MIEYQVIRKNREKKFVKELENRKNGMIFTL